MSPFALVAIGGSAGSIEALRAILACWSRPLQAAVVIALHQYPHRGELLCQLVARFSSAQTVMVEDQTPLRAGVLHVCPANYHTLVEPGRTLALSTDPRVQHARPSIDVLFDSAARAYRRQAIGVLLSGFGEDGVAGLLAIRHAGGLAFCQDPKTASAPPMPESALRRGPIDFTGSPEQLGKRLWELCA